jgi:hypothetical protein
MGDPEQVATLHKEIIKKAGKLDVQVNAAAHSSIGTARLSDCREPVGPHRFCS